MSSTKVKLINLVSALEEVNIIDYCYTFIGLKVCGKAKLPESITEELRTLRKNHDLPSESKPKEKEQTPAEKRAYEYRTNIIRKLWTIDSVGILNYISAITDDIYKEWKQISGGMQA